MDYGFNVPNAGPLATAESIRALAGKGEELGFTTVVAVDHIVIPKTIDSRYPYSSTGKFTPVSRGADECLEQLGVLSYLAGVTSKLRLMTSVMVVPYRHPVLTAKLVATIDVLSGGRVTLGCGAGWMEEEFGPVGAPPYAERGRVTDEYIRVFKELWTSEAPSFDGDYVRFSDITFAPKPVQKPHPPIWIGGESDPAMRRAARLGDGWYPIGINPRFPLDTAQRYAAGGAKLRRFAEEAGRDPAEIDLGLFAPRYDEKEAQTTDDGERRMLTGGPREIAEDIQRLGDIGTRHLVLGCLAPTLEEALGRMEFFMSEIKPLAGD